VASDYMDKKSMERFGEEGQAPDNAAPTVRCAVQELLRRCGDLLCLGCPALLSVVCSVQRRPLTRVTNDSRVNNGCGVAFLLPARRLMQTRWPTS
jgi:hypothetical protein